MIAARSQGGDTLGRGQSGQAALLEGGILLPATPGAGKLFPQPTGIFHDRPGRLDDLVGTGVQLFVSGATVDGCDGTTVIPLNDDRPDAFVETGEPSAAAWLDYHSAVAALVRPDHYVYGTAATPAEAAELAPRFWRALTERAQDRRAVNSTR
jgi:3-(3-hydroxy-phenyl)propionate hydroxylase